MEEEKENTSAIDEAIRRWQGVRLRQKVEIIILIAIAFLSWMNYKKGIDVQNAEIASRRKAVRYEEDLLQQKKQQFETDKRTWLYYKTYGDTILKYCPCHIKE